MLIDLRQPKIILSNFSEQIELLFRQYLININQEADNKKIISRNYSLPGIVSSKEPTNTPKKLKV